MVIIYEWEVMGRACKNGEKRATRIHTLEGFRQTAVPSPSRYRTVPVGLPLPGGKF